MGIKTSRIATCDFKGCIYEQPMPKELDDPPSGIFECASCNRWFCGSHCTTLEVNNGLARGLAPRVVFHLCDYCLLPLQKMLEKKSLEKWLSDEG